jgi:hypothetical protein
MLQQRHIALQALRRCPARIFEASACSIKEHHQLAACEALHAWKFELETFCPGKYDGVCQIVVLSRLLIYSYRAGRKHPDTRMKRWSVWGEGIYKKIRSNYITKPVSWCSWLSHLSNNHVMLVRTQKVSSSNLDETITFSSWSNSI